ncbi:opioid growth factor receptor-like [Pseudophryne corroboree]|uniref:opioid growth factor receptor-like n=1 Tax=Pseudophryne corroboree TaxID=495146 RepID=UPI0030814BD3
MERPSKTTQPRKMIFHSDKQWNLGDVSSWEDEERPQKQKRKVKQGETSYLTPNLDFYQNNMCFEPNGVHIDELLAKWKNDYIRLEMNHCYISWLFPLQQPGRNSYAKPLTVKEIKSMKEDTNVMRRFIESYKLMLGFYGINLCDERTGEVGRAYNWEERFKNLNNHSHNNLRITRILKCLGELGYEHFQAPLVRFFLEETLCNGQLQNVKGSVLDYFISTVRDKRERSNLEHFATKHYKPQEKFKLGPVEKRRNRRT